MKTRVNVRGWSRDLRLIIKASVKIEANTGFSGFSGFLGFSQRGMLFFPYKLAFAFVVVVFAVVVSVVVVVVAAAAVVVG